MTVWTPRPWGGTHNPTPPAPNPFESLADPFRGGEVDPTDRGFLVYKPAAVLVGDVGENGMDLEPVRGGDDLEGSLWFTQDAANQWDGFLVYKELGPGVDTPAGFDARARFVVTNSDEDDDPPVAVGEYRYLVMAVHDPARTNLNYVHLGIGADPDGLQVEVKTTDCDGVTGQSVYPVVGLVGDGGGLRYDVRIVRRTTNTDIFDFYYRPTTGVSLTSNAGWITLPTVVDRDDNTVPVRAHAERLPTDVQLGFAVYASPEIHDIHGRVLGFVVLPTED